jgi:hypothetical protein
MFIVKVKYASGLTSDIIKFCETEVIIIFYSCCTQNRPSIWN